MDPMFYRTLFLKFCQCLPAPENHLLEARKLSVCNTQLPRLWVNLFHHLMVELHTIPSRAPIHIRMFQIFLVNHNFVRLLQWQLLKVHKSFNSWDFLHVGEEVAIHMHMLHGLLCMTMVTTVILWSIVLCFLVYCLVFLFIKECMSLKYTSFGYGMDLDPIWLDYRFLRSPQELLWR